MLFRSNDTATTEIYTDYYTLSLHDALPISVSLNEMDASWSGRTIGDSAYRASIAVLGAIVPMAPGETRPFYFQVSNEGTERWAWDPSIAPFLHIVHRLLDEQGAPLEEWRPSFFTEWIPPGHMTIVPAHVDAPTRPGQYLLDIKVRHSPQEHLFGATEQRTLHVCPGGTWGTHPPTQLPQ